MIYCCGCKSKVEARLTDGIEIYPHRKDLSNLPFWKCDYCGNYVGCHHKTSNPTAPLGCIPTKEIREARKRIHSLLDPMWKTGGHNRKDLYKKISAKTGRNFHTSHIRSIDEAKEIYTLIQEINDDR